MKEDLEPTDEVQKRLGERSPIRMDTEQSDRLRSKFPLDFGRIDWQHVPQHIHVAPPWVRKPGENGPEVPFQSDEYAVEVFSFLEECLTSAERDDPWVAYTGDSMTEEYEVERSALQEFLQIMAFVPDQKYVFALDASWCLMWSMECQMYFGLTPARLPRKRR
jgi:hypothetical protein